MIDRVDVRQTAPFEEQLAKRLLTRAAQLREEAKRRAAKSDAHTVPSESDAKRS